MTNRNIFPEFQKMTSRQFKENKLNQKAKVIWFTGMSGSGKTTISSGLEKKLFEKGYFVQVLDGDNVRTGINNNLGFSEEDRIENIRRIAEVSKLFLNSGVILLCAFISPTNQIRQIAKNIIGEEDFIEIFIDTSLEVCEQRDPKGLYKKARKGEIKNFTGISAPFEVPENPFLTIDNTSANIEKTATILLNKIIPEIKKI